MNKRIILAKASEVGPMGRGQAGKKKVYEIVISDNVVTFSWGMAEKMRRQTYVQKFATNAGATQEAMSKKWAKIESGYEVILDA
jgi:predicted DNA-binding WGR domain protein